MWQYLEWGKQVKSGLFQGGDISLWLYMTGWVLYTGSWEVQLPVTILHVILQAWLWATARPGRSNGETPYPHLTWHSQDTAVPGGSWGQGFRPLTCQVLTHTCIPSRGSFIPRSLYPRSSSGASAMASLCEGESKEWRTLKRHCYPFWLRGTFPKGIVSAKTSKTTTKKTNNLNSRPIIQHVVCH